eukprot:1178168-Prorocentrum_minimum.AAC.1
MTQAMTDEEFLTWDQECLRIDTLFVDHFRGGLYAVFARRWLAHFPERQFLWLTEEVRELESIGSNPRQ